MRPCASGTPEHQRLTFPGSQRHLTKQASLMVGCFPGGIALTDFVDQSRRVAGWPFRANRAARS